MSKNTIQYDLNTSVGLMPLIQSLIKPPDSNEPCSKIVLKKSSHSYYKKPGRGHNNDCCDSCGEGGDLICCDRCPSSFHLGCHDPPLDERNIPYGLWVCHTCKMRDSALPIRHTKIDSRAPSKLEQQSDYENPLECSQSFKNKMMRVRSNSCKNSLQAAINFEKFTCKEDMSEACQQELNDIWKLSPMDQLIRAARILNPRQFELPRELKVHFPFPGTEKVDGPLKTNGNGRKGSRGKKVYELDSQGLVPLPAKTCNVCGRSCRKAPLIACDYCDSFYHQDCLDPPLTALPTAMWMCPNHVEQFIDWKLVNSVAATERIKLWNHFNTVLDQDSVKNEFFRKVNRRNPPFRIKQKAKRRDHIEIPSMIEHHYRNPPILLPSMREILRTKGISQGGEHSLPFCDDSHILMMIDAELKDIGEADNKINKIDQNVDQSFKEEERITEEQIEITNKETASTVRICGKKHKTSPKKIFSSKSMKLEEDNASLDMFNSKLFENESIEWKKTKKMDSNQAVINETIPRKVNEIIDCFDDSFVKMLAYQRLQQILMVGTNTEKHPQCIMKTTVQQIAKAEVKSMPLPSQLLTKDDIERIAKEFTSPKRESDIVINQFNDLDAAPIRTNIKKEPVGNEFLSDREKLSSLSKNVIEFVTHLEIRTRAVITPIDIEITGNNWFERQELSRSVYMRYRSLSIGTGQGNDVQLTKYGNCQCISEKHAIIFYDEVTRMYELINYSEFGTVVNGQYYSCDFTNYVKHKEYSTDNSQQHSGGKKSKKDESDDFNKDRKFDKRKLREEINNLIDISRKCNRNRNGNIPNIRMANIVQPNCKCSDMDRKNCGWEGTALLYNGTFLKFGCLSFVFTITEYDCIAEEFDEADNQSDDDM
ncbi:PHD finger protein 12 [Sabethes cyaneus]|uniref:PHD finger protein 12 n=1 Tax=Sabethes cyaneus TaxID=53552 RepID=UPI00237E31F7|nr:PHD finger protein 12 [Sabethes cyaneus]